MLTIFGIKNCDTVKKARKWLDEANVAHRFHDFRKDGLDGTMIDRFEQGLGWQALLNTRGTTWRKLDDSDKEGVDNAKAKALMLAHAAIVKRPVWEKDGEYRLGFAAKDQEEIKDWAKG